MFCNNCGQENADDCLFCVSCGNKIELSDEKTIPVNMPFKKPGTVQESSDFIKEQNSRTPPSQENTHPEPEHVIPPKHENVPPPNFGSSPPPGYGSSPPPDYSNNGSGGTNYSDNRAGAGSSGNSNTGTKLNPFCLASLILAIVAPLSCCGTITPFLGFGCLIIQLLSSIAAIILGVIGKKQVGASNGSQTGSGYGLAGIISGTVFLLLFVIYLILTALGVLTPFIAEILKEVFPGNY